MELDQFVTQDLANEGVWTPVFLYGRPADFDLLILGDDSDAVRLYERAALRKLRKAVSRQADESGYDDESLDGLTGANDEAVIARIAGIRGWKVARKGSKEIGREPEAVTMNGVELKNDAGSYKLLIAKVPALRDFVLKAAGNRTNFLSKPGGNLSKP
jgi:hypothetical protein